MRRYSLTVTFAWVSIVAMVALGGALVWESSRLLQDQALVQAKHTAQSFVTVEIVRELAPSAFSTGGFTKSLATRMHDSVAKGLDSNLIAVRLWTPDGVLFFDSSGPDLLITNPDSPAPNGIPDPSRFETATRSDGAEATAAIVNEISPSGTVARRLDVYTPVRFGTGPIRGVAEVVLSYDETGAAVAGATRTILYVVFAGLLLLWLLLFRTVHTASKRLRFQAGENARLALQDPLTGLPNRRLFGDRLERAAMISGRTGLPLALLVLDIDRFKDVNDTLGHPRGDALLVQVAERLTRIMRESDTVARLGGDEFAVLLPVVDSVVAAEGLARRVATVFDQPFNLDGLILHVDGSIGLAVMPNHGDDIDTLMARADIAMYTAKSSGMGLATYSAADAHAEHGSGRLMLLGDLRRALDVDDQLHMHYQPKIDLRTGEVIGLEALLRWNHPELGNVPPDQFIPAAEQTGLMHPITARVLGLVATQLGEWLAAGIELPVAVNLSARNLLEPDLDEVVASLIEMHKLPPHLLEFEITESALIEDPVRVGEMLSKLTALGMTVAVDDFGIGSTSMSQLITMPLRTLKIDRSFVTNLATDAPGAVLVKAIVDLAHEFGLTAVAEGVEDYAAIERLQAMGCDTAQGFHWSRPVTAADLPAVLRRLEADRVSV